MPAGLLERLRADPGAAAVFLDVDGTLAPIVPRPDDAFVPAETRAEVARLVRTYALVACVSGRETSDAARMVAVPGALYVGSHGLELDPAADAWRPRLRAFAATVAWPVEDKGVTVSFHYRTAPDPEAAEAQLVLVAERARAEGLDARFGRKVLEIRPPVAADKGTAVKHLLAQHTLGRALYAGDDTTDLDAFRALDDGRLDLGVKVAVASAEAPAALTEAADVVVEGTAGLLALLRGL